MANGILEAGDTVTIDGHGGIAWVFDGMRTERVWIEMFDDSDVENVIDYGDWEEQESEDVGAFHMVGDDRTWYFDISDAAPLDDEEFCSGCGQIGCGW